MIVYIAIEINSVIKSKITVNIEQKLFWQRRILLYTWCQWERIHLGLLNLTHGALNHK